MASAHQPEEAWKEPSTALNKSSLVPLWIIQSAVLLLYIGVLSWEFSSLGWYPGYDDEAFSPLPNIIILTLCVTCLLLDITEMILFWARKLKPLLFLVFQVAKVALWLGLFAVCVFFTSYWDAPRAEYVFASGLIVVVIILITFLASLALGSMIYHRHCKTSRNTIYRPIPDTHRRRTLTEEGCTRPRFPGPDLVHPAYRGSICKGPKCGHADPPTLIQAMDHPGPY
ncbi:MAG: hypothetical protein FRX48_02679 [Lasallia pustulata]|uniref:Uncharacterized protein n=1 Tax=Lasallia pustulata TaxID=136370 RepID=A0A5M8PZ39_9LECA|nr:MAG: hypothetical protein FRX48_02679 [Lasallia pustulata]